MRLIDLLRKMRKSMLFVIGIICFVIILLACFVGPIFAKWGYSAIDLRARFTKPEWFSSASGGHILGTDALGRDMLTRLILGGRSSLVIAAGVVGLCSVIGITVGLISGYFGGMVDTVLMRICDIFMAVPSLLLAICIVTIWGTSFFNLIFVLALSSWPSMARLIRAQVLSVKNMDYVRAAKVCGAHNFWIIFKEVFPNVLMPLIITVTERIGTTILTETSMSYLGMGVPAPTPSWGGMISDGRGYITTEPFVVIVPGIALMFTVLAVNFLGDGLRDILDPRNKD
jgi:ABC-type dipeptide/oligopeptide/nickel transport system permease subunit